MKKVFYCDISNLQNLIIKNDIISKERIEFLDGILDYNRKKQSYIVWKLLEYAVRELGLGACSFTQTVEDKWIENENKFFFSLSHSYDIIAVGVDTDNQIGIDVEKCTRRIFNVRRKLVDFMPENLSEEEKIFLLTTKWTEIESEFKCEGANTTYKSIKIKDTNNNDYILTACSGGDIEFFNIESKYIV